MRTATVRRTLYPFVIAAALAACGCGGSSSSSPPPPVPHTVTVAAQPADGGLVSGGGTFAHGATTTLTALPAEGYLFSGWSGGVAGTADPLTVAVSADLAAVAEFREGGRWTWMGGIEGANRSSARGTLGISNPANHPGSRYRPVTWTDAEQNLWLFGGLQIVEINSTTGSIIYDASLWRFDGTAWSWMQGPQASHLPGVFGTQGMANPVNHPGGREGAAAWKDRDGNFWLFGGLGTVSFMDSTGWRGNGDITYNDLWRFDGESWAWMGGYRVSTYDDWLSYCSAPSYGGIYGTLGITNPANWPGAREGAEVWVDSSGGMWMMGGLVPDSTKRYADLWRHDGAAWTWVGGSSSGNLDPQYGVLGVAEPGNFPGSRSGSAAWWGSAGKGWLFGGLGNYRSSVYLLLSDVWEFDGESWRWIAGSNAPNQYSTNYGIRGIPGSGGLPGAREQAACWGDGAGNMWLYGGAVFCSGDLWRFDGRRWAYHQGPTTYPSSPQWGTLGVPDVANNPGSRWGAASWTDGQGNLWLYGGKKRHEFGVPQLDSFYSDLWRYTP